MSRLLVTGGTGSLGRHLVPLLLERGHEARVLSRSASAKVAPQVEVVRGDVLTGDNLAAAVEGVGEAEKVVESAGMPWTIQRATQFHDLLDYLLGRRVFVRTPHLAFQVVDPAEVSARLADLVEAGPSARAPDFDRGRHHCPGHREGRTTWSDWLRRNPSS